uniref:Uncharacterized protein n=1 Tax=Tanacetum cinerariifolium TaxID=118510 RepID=A0A6L2LVA2_TANCI|nr:hypothetical protein [Tanacetum cinerariifolium]
MFSRFSSSDFVLGSSNGSAGKRPLICDVNLDVSVKLQSLYDIAPLHTLVQLLPSHRYQRSETPEVLGPEGLGSETILVSGLQRFRGSDGLRESDVSDADLLYNQIRGWVPLLVQMVSAQRVSAQMVLTQKVSTQRMLTKRPLIEFRLSLKQSKPPLILTSDGSLCLH